ncbi:hypothetical protein ONZ51_g1645 [Trametes cubensis]|uniref:Lactam utilization protein lamB n=1 Tax=Trametes cubensis TaxID=1111947 RepID=A0AAD7XCS6_9APHY|nr:hypothetical protein ONZ51_g1645 [Trametes cubensis]
MARIRATVNCDMGESFLRGRQYKKQWCIYETTGRADEQVADGGGGDGKVGARFNATNASWALHPSGCRGVWLATGFLFVCRHSHLTGYSLYKMGDDAALMKTIHLANIACGFHASDFSIMNETVRLAKTNNVRIGAHPSLPDRQGFGRREMAMEPDELASCFIYQVGALMGFLVAHGLTLNHIKPHGAVYGMTARDPALARAAVGVAKTFAKELGVPFIAEWFVDMEYSPEGKLLITKTHEPLPASVVRDRVNRLLEEKHITTTTGSLPLTEGVTEVSICCHSDTPGAVEIAETVKALVDRNNAQLQ